MTEPLDLAATAGAPRAVVYVVDDDASIRTLWQWLVESKGLAVQTFATAAEFIDCYRDEGAACLVLDLLLPGMNGLELQAWLKQRGIEIPIVFVSAHGDVPAAVSALKEGAIDFLQKPFGYRDAMQVVERALERDAAQRSRRAQRSEVASRLAALTEREREVMDRVIDGKPNKVIAAELGISMKTVEVHRAKVMEKTGAASLAELVQLVLQRNS